VGTTLVKPSVTEDLREEAGGRAEVEVLWVVIDVIVLQVLGEREMTGPARQT